MNQFIGTKIINAKPMNRLEYNNFRGWDLPADENGADEGYLVEYLDGGQANTSEFEGYVSWSPEKQFEDAYKQSGELSFGDAIEYLKRGFKVARSGWNGKGMYLQLVHCDHYDLLDSKVDNMVRGPEWNLEPFIIMYTATKKLQPGWLASQADILANDWCIVEGV